MQLELANLYSGVNMRKSTNVLPEREFHLVGKGGGGCATDIFRGGMVPIQTDEHTCAVEDQEIARKMYRTRQNYDFLTAAP